MSASEVHWTTIVPHDPSWARDFAEIAPALLSRASGRLHSIEHIGSTAVSGLAAKPVIDLLGELSVRSLAGEQELADVLGPLGFFDRPGEFTDRFLFSRCEDGVLTHNLHVVPRGTLSTRNEILFRDRLRRDPLTMSRYSELKYELARRSYGDPHGYSRAKSAFVFDVVSQERERLQLPPWDIWDTLGPKRRGGWSAEASRPPTG
jgi:GrpB-like predicted nucleotidyltransferase (UPF0157 family)